MAANTSPVFPIAPCALAAQNVILSTAMTSTKAFDGTEAAGTSMALVATAGANGARLDQLTLNYSGTNGAAPSGTSAASVLRLWLNNGSANTTAGNNILINNVAVPALAYTNVARMDPLTLSLDMSIPAGWKLYAGLSTAMGGTNCALAVTVTAGDY